MQFLLKRCQRHVRLGVIHAYLTVISVGAIGYFSRYDATDVFEHGWRFAASVFVTICCAWLQAQLALTLGGRVRWLRILNCFLLTLITLLLLGYHLRTRSYFDPSVMLEQSDVTLDSEVIRILTSAIDWTVVAGGVLGFAVLSALELRWPIVFPEQPSPIKVRGFTAIVGYAAVLCLPAAAYDEMTRTVSAIVGRHNARGLEVTLKPGEYPLMHATKPATRAATGTEPRDVFVVLVESFNANAVEARADNGKEYTPFFNSLIPSGLYIERFYGNSVQTAKGHFATFCSLLPSMKSREFVTYADKNLDCLPDVLSRFDYETIFFQTYRNINYDNTRQFLTRNGFDQVESIESHWHKSDRQHSWGWGLQDDLFYRRFFEYYDATLATEVADRPLFVALAPISNHMRFDRVPRKERKMYGNPTKPEQYFANSVNVADRGLKAFFQELRRRKRFANAIVIITGDHSFPVGEHGFYHNETNAYDESFRVPFLMIAPGLVSPERVRDVPYSQLDIAPTIIDATGVHPDRTHFMGRSILEQPRTVAPVYLVQPYAGRYLGVVEYPLKYVLNLQTGQQRLFNLTSDPRELTNLDGKRELVATESHLKSLLRTHFLVKNALEQNQVWN